MMNAKVITVQLGGSSIIPVATMLFLKCLVHRPFRCAFTDAANLNDTRRRRRRDREIQYGSLESSHFRRNPTRAGSSCSGNKLEYHKPRLLFHYISKLSHFASRSVELCEGWIRAYEAQSELTTPIFTMNSRAFTLTHVFIQDMRPSLFHRIFRSPSCGLLEFRCRYSPVLYDIQRHIFLAREYETCTVLRGM